MSYISPFRIKNAVRHIKAGQIIAYPTEAVYGLGCDPLNENAVWSLLTLKQRHVDKGLILIAASLQQLQPYLLLNAEITKRVNAQANEPITWLIPVQPWVPKWLTGKHDKLAVRITQHPVALALCEQYGKPLVSTSANISQQPAIKTPIKLSKTFGATNVFMLHGRLGNLQKETAIVDVLSQQRLR